MITFTRDFARLLRVVLRKAGAGRNRSLLQAASADGELCFRAHLSEIAIEHKQPCDGPSESILFPTDVLADVEGKSTALVTLESVEGGVEACWENGLPKQRHYAVDAKDDFPPLPQVDWHAATEVPGLLQALANASECTDAHSKYGTIKIQLRGASGEVIATDGRQALIQGGFSFSWKEDFLVPSLAVFSMRELWVDRPAVVVSENHLGIKLGTWTFHLLIDRQSRFPNVAQVVPTLPATATVLRLSAQDASFARESLPRLPGGKEAQSPVTLDLNGQVALRAREEDETPTEIILAHSRTSGPALRVHLNREHLGRALRLGFQEIGIIDAETPLVCLDRLKKYVWVPLAKSMAIPPSNKAIRVTSPSASGEPTSSSSSERTTMQPQQTQPHVNGAAEKNGDHDETSAANGRASNPIQEAQALRDALQEACAQAGRLVSALKRQRKQSRLLSTTLASLKQLQSIDA